MIEELLFFSQFKFSEKSIKDLSSNLSLGILLKRSTENLPGDIDEIVLQVVFGNKRKPPGDEMSPSQKLITRENEETYEDALIGQ